MIWILMLNRKWYCDVVAPSTDRLLRLWFTFGISVLVWRYYGFFTKLVLHWYAVTRAPLLFLTPTTNNDRTTWKKKPELLRLKFPISQDRTWINKLSIIIWISFIVNKYRENQWANLRSQGLWFPCRNAPWWKWLVETIRTDSGDTKQMNKT